MATKEIVTSVVSTLVNGTQVTVSAHASPVWAEFLRGRAVVDDVGNVIPYTSILSALPRFDSVEVDMSDTSCVPSGGNCDGDFTLTTPQGSFCINASDITGCDEFDEESYPSALLEGAVLTDGDTYTSNLSQSDTYYVEDGILAVHGFAFLENVGNGVRVYFSFAEGSSCDEKVAQVANALTQYPTVVSYSGGEPGPKQR